MLIPLVARTDVEHEGSILPAGTRFEATPIEAAILRYQRRADFAPPGRLDLTPIPEPVVTAPAQEPVTRKRGRPKKTEAPDATPPASRPARRTYRRRDLTAEPT